MNNKPVAWMWYQSKENTNPYTQMTGYSQLCFSEFEPDCNVVTVDDGTLTPLYTHPIKQPMMVLDGNRVYSVFKELTDEEIRAEWYNNCGKDDWFMDFARAILRKAQEK